MFLDFARVGIRAASTRDGPQETFRITREIKKVTIGKYDGTQVQRETQSKRSGALMFFALSQLILIAYRTILPITSHKYSYDEK